MVYLCVSLNTRTNIHQFQNSFFLHLYNNKKAKDTTQKKPTTNYHLHVVCITLKKAVLSIISEPHDWCWHASGPVDSLR